MGKVYTVEDIKDLAEDTVVQRFTGKIVKLFDQKTGDNDNGEWSLQGLILKDDNGDEIRVTLKDRDELPRKMRGREITLLAHKGNKGWSGVYAKDDTYRDKKHPERILWVTGSAEVVEAGGADEDEGEEEEREERRDRRRDRNEDRGSRNRRRDREEEDEEEDEEGEDDRRGRKREDPERIAKHACLKLSNGIGLAMEASFYSAQAFEKRNGITVPIEFIQAMTMWMAISLERRGVFDDLPIESIFPDPEESEKGSKGKGRKGEDEEGEKGDEEEEDDKKTSRKAKR